MNSRERILAVTVGGLLVLLAMWFAFSLVEGMFRTRRAQIAALRNDIQTKERKLRIGRAAAARMKRLAEQSLPSDTSVARSLYQDWLLELAERHELDNINVTTSGGQSRNGVYFLHGFGMSGRGNLEQLSKLLFDFHSADMLHRIRRISVRPVKDSKDLDVSFAVEAVSLPAADHEDALHLASGDRLTRPLDEYLTEILNRNLFGPANNPPKLASLSSQRTIVGRPFSLTAKASEPDKLDRVEYSLVDAPTDARIDPKSGEVRWSPQSKGDFTLTLVAMDDGLPRKSDRQTVKVSVVDPPPPPPPPKPDPPLAKPAKPKLDFDDAKYTVLTAVIEVKGEPQIWLAVRRKGETLMLKQGDKVSVGSVTGIVSRIGETTADIDTDDEKRLQVALGETLLQGQAVEKTE